MVQEVNREKKAVTKQSRKYFAFFCGTAIKETGTQNDIKENTTTGNNANNTFGKCSNSLSISEELC